MFQQFHEAVQAVIRLVQKKGYSAKTVEEIRRYEREFEKHLSALDKPYDFDTVVHWLEQRKTKWAPDTYNRYRRAAYRIQQYMNTGEIIDTSYRPGGAGCYVYHDMPAAFAHLTENWRNEFRRFNEYSRLHYERTTIDHHRVPAARFMLFLAENGCAEPSDCTADLMIRFHDIIESVDCSEDKKAKYRDTLSAIARYWHEMGYIPSCFQQISRIGQFSADVPDLHLPSDVNPHAGRILDAHIERFVFLMNERRYSFPSEICYLWILHHFFLFLERNHLPFSEENAQLWLESIPKTTSWEHKRRILTFFISFVNTNRLPARNNIYKQTGMQLLPDWCCELLVPYLEERTEDGYAPSTLCMIRSSCVRFLKFLHKQGLTDIGGLTPELLHSFHLQDSHCTPQGKNAYNSRIRKFLTWLADKGLVPSSLVLVLDGRAAPVRHIPVVLTEEMIQTIYTCRERASSPLALRNTAIVLLGLRMGLRASDIAALKLGDIDWKQKQISLVQKKTGKPIMLPLPNDVGNSLYRYLTEGRPVPGTNADGFVFLKHRAPYGRMERTICRNALLNILSQDGHILPAGCGFHVTRKTFATNLLSGGVKADRIAEALGHSTRLSLQVYLSLEESGMRRCPLPFSCVKGGETHG